MSSAFSACQRSHCPSSSCSNAGKTRSIRFPESFSNQESVERLTKPGRKPSAALLSSVLASSTPQVPGQRLPLAALPARPTESTTSRSCWETLGRVTRLLSGPELPHLQPPLSGPLSVLRAGLGSILDTPVSPCLEQDLARTGSADRCLLDAQRSSTKATQYCTEPGTGLEEPGLELNEKHSSQRDPDSLCPRAPLACPWRIKMTIFGWQAGVKS